MFAAQAPQAVQYDYVRGGLQGASEKGAVRARDPRAFVHTVDEDPGSPGSQDEDEEEEVNEWREYALGILAGAKCSAVVGSVIISNTVMMAVQSDHPDWECWLVLELLFMLFFVVELALRLYAFRLDFFFGDDKGWNIFDFTIVGMGLIDLLATKVFSLGEGHHKAAKFVTVLRCVRILRLLRVLRLFKQLRQLYLLSMGLIESMKVVFWISVLFMILIVVSAIFMTNLVGHDAQLYEEVQPGAGAKIRFYFGTVEASMNTLFQFLTLDDWSSVARLVTILKPEMWAFFILYIMVTSFTVLSLLTGVIAEHMLSVTKEEDERLERENNTKFTQFVEELGELFIEADVDKSRTISKEEFKALMSKKKVQARLEALDIEVETVELLDIFEAIDIHRTGELSHHDFQEGFLRMRGPATAKDVLKVYMSVERLVQRVPSARGIPAIGRQDTRISRQMDGLVNSVADLTTRVSSIEHEMTDLMSFMGRRRDDIDGSQSERSQSHASSALRLFPARGL